jgi:hypothetical protein
MTPTTTTAPLPADDSLARPSWRRGHWQISRDAVPAAARPGGYKPLMPATGSISIRARWYRCAVVSGIDWCDVDEHDDHRFSPPTCGLTGFPAAARRCRYSQGVVERAAAHS